MLADFGVLFMIFAGVCIGILFGASPGLTTSMGMAFMLPLTYIMEPTQAIAMLIGLYIGGTSGGLITAILLGIPGTPASISTTFDGYPMAKNGEPGKALGYGLVASFFGGMVSLLALFCLAPALSKVALKFGPADYFAVSLFSLALIAGLAGKSLVRGLIGGILGVMLATVGTAPLDMTTRYTMGIHEFDAGFQLLCVLVGVYAVTELLRYAENSCNAPQDLSYNGAAIRGMGVKLSDFKGQAVNMVRSTILGTCIGILPGIGAGTSNILAYSAAKNASKYPEKFGSGIKDGIIASETANNAVTGGALIPLLTLGIPGDAGTAILLAALTLHGIAPGPLVFQKNGDQIYMIFAALIVANLFMLLVEYLGMKMFIKMVRIPKNYLLTVILLLCVIGAYGQNNRIFDVYSVLMFGVLGFVFYKMSLPLTPMIMGFILGPIVETNLLRGLQFSDGSFLAFFKRPIAAVFLIMTACYVMYEIKNRVGRGRKEKMTDG
ncbi:MAG: tripartite tricarboxylate transporter permease [Lachnospiraceae bacterium]|nr:tripartite tricarboxylate transporter permease [Lachnospiraceae bacterium]